MSPVTFNVTVTAETETSTRVRVDLNDVRAWLESDPQRPKKSRRIDLAEITDSQVQAFLCSDKDAWDNALRWYREGSTPTVDWVEVTGAERC